jgi:hypothetical protein
MPWTRGWIRGRCCHGELPDCPPRHQRRPLRRARRTRAATAARGARRPARASSPRREAQDDSRGHLRGQDRQARGTARLDPPPASSPGASAPSIPRRAASAFSAAAHQDLGAGHARRRAAAPGTITAGTDSGIACACGDGELLLDGAAAPRRPRLPVAEVLRGQAGLFAPGLALRRPVTLTAPAPKGAEAARGALSSPRCSPGPDPRARPRRPAHAARRTRPACCRELCAGTLRHYPLLDALLAQLLDRPLRARDRELRGPGARRPVPACRDAHPPHAAVSATVDAPPVLRQVRTGAWSMPCCGAFSARRTAIARQAWTRRRRGPPSRLAVEALGATGRRSAM